MAKLCGYWSITPQAHHAHRKRRQASADRNAALLQFVLDQRSEQPRLGTRKLLHLVQQELDRQPHLAIGRDALFELLDEHDLLIRPLKTWVRTTDSQHRLRVYDNVLADHPPQRAHEAWVADITYIAARDGFRYLALLSDAYSRKIVGYDLSASLSIEGSERALAMALAQLPSGAFPIHHSDRGVQYCSHRYTGVLRERGLRISMAEVGNPYQNAIAERINGILKQEYQLDAEFADEQTARQAVHEAIRLYNTRRPHLSLAMQTPEQVHREQESALRTAA